MTAYFALLLYRLINSSAVVQAVSGNVFVMRNAESRGSVAPPSDAEDGAMPSPLGEGEPR